MIKSAPLIRSLYIGVNKILPEETVVPSGPENNFILLWIFINTQHIRPPPDPIVRGKQLNFRVINLILIKAYS